MLNYNRFCPVLNVSSSNCGWEEYSLPPSIFPKLWVLGEERTTQMMVTTKQNPCKTYTQLDKWIDRQSTKESGTQLIRNRECVCPGSLEQRQFSILRGDASQIVSKFNIVSAFTGHRTQCSSGERRDEGDNRIGIGRWSVGCDEPK